MIQCSEISSSADDERFYLRAHTCKNGCKSASSQAKTLKDVQQCRDFAHWFLAIKHHDKVHTCALRCACAHASNFGFVSNGCCFQDAEAQLQSDCEIDREVSFHPRHTAATSADSRQAVMCPSSPSPLSSPLGCNAGFERAEQAPVLSGPEWELALGEYQESYGHMFSPTTAVL